MFIAPFSREKLMEDITIILRDTFLSNVDPRRKQELVDSRMIQEDHRAISNLPPVGFQREFNPDRYVEHFNMYNQSSRKYK